MFRRGFIAIIPIALFCAISVGCNTQKDLATTETEVVRFHERLNHQDFMTIYTEADPDFRSASKQDDFLAFMNAVHKKLGDVESGSRQSFFVNFTTSGTQFRLAYSTKFSGGDAQEQFIWRKSGDRFLLFGYNINSTAFIIK